MENEAIGHTEETGEVTRVAIWAEPKQEQPTQEEVTAVVESEQ